MEPLNHQMMGYDRAVSMFSPDGRLLQVEYAKKTVKQGSTALAIVCSDGVVIIAEKKLPSKLVIPESVEKIFEIDGHIAVTFAGITSDARVLVERSQVKAQQHRITYESSIDAISVVKDIADLKQYTTQSGGIRPFGVSLVIAGVDTDGAKVYVTDPTGIYFQCKAIAIGENDTKVEEILVKEYKESITITEALKLGIKALKSSSEEGISAERVEAAYIKSEDKKFVRVSKSEIAKLV
jgi:proteasome alpha subunit